MQIKVEGDIPSVNHVWRKGKNGVMYSTKKGTDFKRKLGWIALSLKIKPVDGAVKFYLEWHCKKVGRGDLDNKLKSCQDGLNGIAYFDDSQIKEIHAIKVENSTFNGAIIEVTKI